MIDVAIGALVDHDIGLGRLPGVHQRRQLLILHLNQPTRVGRRALVQGNHCSDAFAEVAYLVDRQRALRWGQFIYGVESRAVLTRHDRQHARQLLRLAGVDLPDITVGDGAVQHLGKNQTVQINVICIHRAPGYFVETFHARNAFTDDSELVFHLLFNDGIGNHRLHFSQLHNRLHFRSRLL